MFIFSLTCTSDISVKHTLSKRVNFYCTKSFSGVISHFYGVWILVYKARFHTPLFSGGSHEPPLFCCLLVRQSEKFCRTLFHQFFHLWVNFFLPDALTGREASLCAAWQLHIGSMDRYITVLWWIIPDRHDHCFYQCERFVRIRFDVMAHLRGALHRYNGTSKRQPPT